MTPHRTVLTALLTTAFIGPLFLLVVESLRTSNLDSTAVDFARLAGLAANTLILAVGAALVAVPFGAVTAVVLERIAVPGRSVLRALVVIGLFVPLPVTAVAWQVVLGSWLPPLDSTPGQVAWRPWAEGLLPAAWVHGVAGLPWVVWIVGAGLRSTDRALEEDALLGGGPTAVFRRVVAQAAAAAAAAAAAWVAVQTMTEITVTDAMMVRTFAEEVYAQFVGAADGLAGAVAVTLPVWFAAVSIVFLVVKYAKPSVLRPAADAQIPRPIPCPCGVTGAASIFVWVGAMVFAALPLAALAWKAGGGGTRDGWQLATQADALTRVVRTDGLLLAGSAGTAAVTGLLAASLGWVACRAAVGSRWFSGFLLALCVLLWVTPGPLAGLGLKAAIDALIGIEERILDPSAAVLRPLLYDRPSPVPAVWAGVLRLFPVAVAVVWPAVRAVPRDLLDAARIDGLGWVGEWRCVFGPLTGPAVLRAAVAVAALSLGEVAATKLVNPPGRSAYVLRLFDQMHYGAESTVAALALVQVAATAAAATLLVRAGQSHPRAAQ